MATTWRWPIERSPTRRVDVDAELDRREPLRAPRAAWRATSRKPPARELAAEEEVRGDVEAGTRSSSWKIVAMPAACASRGLAKRTGVAVDRDGALVRRVHAREDVHQRRLAGAVLAEQRVDLAGLQVEIDAAQRLDAAEALGDARASSGAAGHLRGLPAVSVTSGGRPTRSRRSRAATPHRTAAARGRSRRACSRWS